MKGQVMLEEVYKDVDKAEKELHYYENRAKILEHQITKLTRKERTHRLCTRRAMLEKYLQDPNILTNEDEEWFLQNIFYLKKTNDLLATILAKE